MDIVFHYPPELMSLLIETIPRLCRGKKDVLLFFRGAGIEDQYTRDLQAQLDKDRAAIGKHEMVRTVITRLNQKGETTLRERRELLRRVVAFEDFSSCWDEDRLKAKGLVAEIQRVVNVKDSFTRMSLEREAESRSRREAAESKVKATQRTQQERAGLRDELFAIFGMSDAWARGRKLESILNRLFMADELQVRESFTLKGDQGQGIVEQIDGVVEVDSHLYLVEIKWWKDPLGPGDVAQHQVRVFNRDQSRGIFISASGYTDAAVLSCKESLAKAVFVLCELEELVRALEAEQPLREFFRAKIQAAIVDKQPLKRVI